MSAQVQKGSPLSQNDQCIKRNPKLENNRIQILKHKPHLGGGKTELNTIKSLNWKLGKNQSKVENFNFTNTKYNTWFDPYI